MKKYKTVLADPRRIESPCDLCERVECIGVELCEREYGNDYYFKEIKDKGYEQKENQ